MKAPTSPPLNRQILDEASAWFVDFRVCDIDATARARFDQWLRRSPEHIRAYLEIAKTYVELPSARAGADLDVEQLVTAARAEVTNVAPFTAWRGAPQLVGGQDSAKAAAAMLRVSRAHRSSHWRVGLAASVVLVFLAGVLSAWFWPNRFSTYATQIGENRSITLGDGSTIDLNARSKVRIEFSRHLRNVELLEGQALFEVAHDVRRPFIVRSGPVMVRAVGTQFDVNRGRNGTTVTVIEGRVEVVKEGSTEPEQPTRDHDQAEQAPSSEVTGHKPTLVSAGEQVTVTARVLTAPKRADVAAATAWAQHRLFFDGTRLDEVVDDFNRYNTRPLIIEDGRLNDFHVSGVYTSTDPASLIRFLREQPGIAVTETDDAVRIRRE